jgi:hypothetical protein
MIINLSNLKHLDISTTYQRLILSGELLLILLKESSQLSPLTSNPQDSIFMSIMGIFIKKRIISKLIVYINMIILYLGILIK